MSALAWGQMAVYFALLLLLAWPAGGWIARVLSGQSTWSTRLLAPIERWLYRAAGIDPAHEMVWYEYAGALLMFSVAGIALVYLMQRLQGWLPLDPHHLPGVPAPLAFNTAVSFVTNTNWQAYSGEATLSNLTQAAGLTVQNFVSAGCGIAVLAALIRGFARRGVATIGNFWVDLVRATLHILLPLASVLALLLASQGVVQTWAASRTVDVAAPVDGGPRTQTIALGPVASQ
ncbi:MAG: potassium-transporting ATPase subunit KdpA, partial [Gemmatimonadales bacterium]